MIQRYKIPVLVGSLALGLSLPGCATEKPSAESLAEGQLQCRVGSTRACKEKHGRVVSCTCTSKDALMDILYPQGQ